MWKRMSMGIWGYWFGGFLFCFSKFPWEVFTESNRDYLLYMHGGLSEPPHICNKDLPEFRKVAVIIYHSEPPLVQVNSSAQNGAWCRNRTDTRDSAGNAARDNAKMARRVLGKRLN